MPAHRVPRWREPLDERVDLEVLSVMRVLDPFHVGHGAGVAE